MVRSQKLGRRLAWNLVVLVSLAPGCSSKGRLSIAEQSPEALQIQKVGDLCLEYRKIKNTLPTIELLQAWAVKEGKASPEEFTSTRDHQPYVLVQAMQGMVVHEQIGADGELYVLTPVGRVVLMAEADMQTMLGAMPKEMSRGRGKR
jgi:hypothetical protein